MFLISPSQAESKAHATSAGAGAAPRCTEDFGQHGLAFAHRPQIHPPRHTFLLWLIASMLVGYFLVFLTTPAPLDWHLDTALDRLLMQITPLILFYAGLWLGQVHRR